MCIINDQHPAIAKTRGFSTDAFLLHPLAPESIARGAGRMPRLRASFTRRLRERLTRIAPQLGANSDEFDATRWSGISFRKGGLSALAPYVQPHELAMHADHASVETTRRYYLSQTVESRAAHTALMAVSYTHLTLPTNREV